MGLVDYVNAAQTFPIPRSRKPSKDSATMAAVAVVDEEAADIGYPS